jgi:5-methyltetrahydropteroyltriglutamate--homocysteine methyltransferase
MSTKPFFRADQVGSLLRPQKLLDARTRWKAGNMSLNGLRALEDEAIAECVKMQENLGLEAVTDGEFRRENWWIDFISAISGIEISEPDQGSAFRQNPEYGGNYVPKNVLTTGKISGGGTISVDDFDYLNRRTSKTVKMMIPSPSRIHFHGGRQAVSQDVYPSMDDFWADIITLYQDEIAALESRGCTYIQIDDPVLTYFLDDRLRVNAAEIGEDPDKLLGLYGDVINACINKRSADTNISIHLCRGNAQSQWIAAGSYDAMAEELFPRVNVDAWFLEYDDDRSGGFEPLRFMPEGTRVVLGLITTKTGEIEDPEEIRARINEAAEVVALDDLALSPQCGFASIDIGNKITFDEQTAKLKMMLDIAGDVWGTA